MAAHSATYYVAPNGNDANNGSISTPFATLNKAWTVVAAGDLIYLRGGTYAFTVQQYLAGKDGVAGNLIKVWAYPGEVPVLTKGAGYTNNYYRGGCYFSGNYVHFKGIEITGFAQPDTYVWNGLLVMNSNNNIFEMMSVHHNGAGMYIQGASSGNLVLNSDFHNNADPITNYGNADGLDIAYVDAGTNNTVRGCRAWNNSDDGFDVFENNGYVAFENCWSFRNGYLPNSTTPSGGNGQGFKLGSTQNYSSSIMRKLTNCLAFNNYEAGFDQNQANCRIEMYNNVAYNNRIHGYFFNYYDLGNISKNNIAFNNSGNQAIFGGLTTSNNNSSSGNGVLGGSGWASTVSSADFLSLSTTGTEDPRPSDGSLPVINFLKLAPTSALINAGTNVGLPYIGNAPDIGAFESGSTLPAPNQPPVANAGLDRTITLPANSVTLTGSGTDVGGSISAYAWTRMSGPNTPTLTGTTTTTFTASNLVAGTYVFRLTVTDNGGLTASDDVNVIVTAVPGPLPAPASLINVASAAVATGFCYYVAQDFGTSPDMVGNNSQSVVRVFENGVELTPPHSAHSDIATLGKGRFSHWSDGSYVALYFSSSDNTDPRTNGRTYTYSITSGTTNLPPVSNAGADKTITLPVNSVTLTGSGTDVGGSISAYAWTRVSGPNTPTLSGATTAVLATSNLVAGTYVFRLTVTDNGGLTAFDDVNVIVAAAPTPQPPPSTSLINVASAAVATGFCYYVAQDFGTSPDMVGNNSQSVVRVFENGVELLPPHSAHSDIATLGKGRFSHWSDGSYVALYFSSSDNTDPRTNGRTYTYSITSGTTNQPPVSNAGADKTITLPVNSVTLTGSGTDVGGSISAYAWTRMSGPNTPVLTGTTTTTLAASNLVAGTYVFRLTVTDNGGLTAFDDVNVVVGAAPSPIPVPASLINVASAAVATGFCYYVAQDFGTSPDMVGNTSQSVLRVFENGVELLPPHSAHSDIATLGKGRFSHWSDGSYVALYFSSSDNTDPRTNGRTYTYSITSGTTNLPPVSNAGADKTVTLPANSVTLTGSGTDVDGSVSSYIWTRVSGPNTPTLSGTTTATLAASNLVAGTYVFRLTVTDNGGLTASDDVNVIVAAAPTPQPPATSPINVASAAVATGFCYYVAQDFGTSPDMVGNTSQSVLRVFENGVELLLPHSAHSDIATLGKGRFSHWSDGSYVALYFSSSDNTDPRTNGRTYTYSITSAVRTANVGQPVISSGLPMVAEPQSEVQIYPNLATSHINIKIIPPVNMEAGMEKISLRIFDAAGSTVHSQQLETTQEITKQVDVSTFKPGVYFVEIIFGEQTRHTLKFVKQ
jgi:hypothetical protein